MILHLNDSTKAFMFNPDGKLLKTPVPLLLSHVMKHAFARTPALPPSVPKSAFSRSVVRHLEKQKVPRFKGSTCSLQASVHRYPFLRHSQVAGLHSNVQSHPVRFSSPSSSSSLYAKS